MSGLVRFYSSKDVHTFWTLSISLSTTCKEVCGTIASKLDNGSQFSMYQEYMGAQQKLIEQSKPLEIKAGWGKNADDYKFILKDETKNTKLVRVYSEDKENTFWTIPIKPDTTAKQVTDSIATKLDTPTSFLLFEIGAGLGEILPSQLMYTTLEKHESQAKFVVRKSQPPSTPQKDIPPKPTLAPTPTPPTTTSHAPVPTPTPTPNSPPPTSLPKQTNNQPQEKQTPPSKPVADPPPDLSPPPIDSTPYTLSSLPPLPQVSIIPPSSTDIPPIQRPPPLDYMVPLIVTDQVLKLISFAFGKLASPEEVGMYTSEYDKLVYLASFPSPKDNPSVQENALRLITNITTDGTNQALIAQTPMLSIIIYLCRYSSGKTQMLAAWVLSNLAVNPETLAALNKHGAPMALMEVLATSNVGDETKEQALRALTNLGKNDECKALMKTSGFAVIATKALSDNAFEDVANLALRVLVNLGLDEAIRDAVVAAGGIPYILQLINSSKEQTVKMASFVLATMSVDGKLNSLIATLGGIPPIVHLLKTPVLFVQEQAVTLVANLALLESNLEVLRVSGVIPPLIALLASESDSIKMKAVWAISNLVVNEENQTALVQEGGLEPLVSLLTNPSASDICGRVAWALSNLTQINDFIRQEVGNMGAIPLLVNLIAAPETELDTRENSLKAVVNMALNYENEGKLYAANVVPVLIQVIRSNTGKQLQKLGFMALVNLSANDKVRVDISKQGGVADAITNATSPSLAQEDAIKLLTNLTINGKIRSQLQKTQLKQTLTSFLSNTALKESIDLALNNLAFPADESDYAEDQAVVDDIIQTMLDLQAKTEEENDREQEANVTVPVKENSEQQEKAYQKRRTRIAMEILSTERTYVQNLTVLVKRFLNPLTSAATSHKPIIKPDQLFSICDVISNYHVMFLEGLERRLMKWKTGASEQLGDYFSQVDFLTIYSEYINNYNDSLAIYNELRKNKAFVNLLQQCGKAPECNCLDLQAFLIQPIQRIPRYNLLLDDLIRHTPPDHPDYKDLKCSNAKIKSIAGFLNENARLEMNKSKVMSIQQNVDGDLGDLLGWKRTFLKEGKMQVDGKVQFMFLFNDMFIITKTPSRGRYELIKKVPFKSASTTACDEKSFKISVEAATFTVKWSNASDRDVWWEEFQKLL